MLKTDGVLFRKGVHGSPKDNRPRPEVKGWVFKDCDLVYFGCSVTLVHPLVHPLRASSIIIYE